MLKLKPDPPLAWRIAIERWIGGKSDHVDELLQGDGPIPKFARGWLVQALAGHVKRKRGPRAKPVVATLWRDAAVWERYERRRAFHEALRKLAKSEGETPPRDGSPSVHAAEECAEAFGISVATVFRIVSPTPRSQ